MRKVLVVLLVLVSLVATAQVKETIVRVNADTSRFLEKYYPRQLIRLDSAMYQLTHATLVGQSLKTAIDSGWVFSVGGVGNADVDLSAYATLESPDFTGISSWFPVTVDSADIDTGGIVNLYSQIIYDDTHDCWGDWTTTDGVQIAAGVDGQVMNIKSISSGRLYLRNNDAMGDTVPAFVMFNGDNITLEYVDGTWIEVARTDFNQEAGGVTPGTGMVYPGVGIPVSSMSSWGSSLMGPDGYIPKMAGGVWTVAPDSSTMDTTDVVATKWYVDNHVGSGTMSSLTAGYGVKLNDLSEETITTSGTASIDTSKIATLYDVASDRDSIITAGIVSSVPAVGSNPGSNISAAKWIQQMYYQSQAPTATLTGGVAAELHSAGTYSTNLTYTGSRQAATAALASIVITGMSQTYSPTFTPCTPAPCPNTGIQSVTVTYNTTNTFTNTVTTSDGKTATATTAFTFIPKRYWGRTLLKPPNSATIVAAAGGDGELVNSRAKGSFTVTASTTPPTSNYIYFAYDEDLGALTSISIGGFESIDAFTRYQINVTNASGYTQYYYVYVSNNTFSGDVTKIITQ